LSFVQGQRKSSVTTSVYVWIGDYEYYFIIRDILTIPAALGMLKTQAVFVLCSSNYPKPFILAMALNFIQKIMHLLS
jgi:hypothetical protein